MKFRSTVSKGQHRTQTGQTSGVIDMLIIVPISIGLILLLLNAGLGMYYHIKLQYIAEGAAKVAASEAGGFFGQIDPAPVQSWVINACSTMGITFQPSANNPYIKPVRISQGLTNVYVTITGTGQLLGQTVNLFPGFVTVTETGMAPAGSAAGYVLFPESIASSPFTCTGYVAAPVTAVNVQLSQAPQGSWFLGYLDFGNGCQETVMYPCN